MEPISLNDGYGEVAALELKRANVCSACPKWIIEVRHFGCLHGATIHSFLHPYFFIIFSALFSFLIFPGILAKNSTANALDRKMTLTSSRYDFRFSVYLKMLCHGCTWLMSHVLHGGLNFP